MEKELASGSIGPEAGYKLEIKGGKARIELNYVGAQATGGVFVEIGLVQLLKEAAKKTENTIDDNLVNLVAVALGESIA